MERDGDAISSTEPDWTRERPTKWWDPSRKLLRAVRRYQAARARSGITSALAKRWWVLSHRVWSVVAQAEIQLDTAEIGGGLLLPHPNGVVVHRETRIGPNCLIFQQVTLGTLAGRQGAPVIGGHVDIGAGARILGPVTIGDHAVIGANSVVLDDVPAGAVAVGAPARILRRSEATTP